MKRTKGLASAVPPLLAVRHILRMPSCLVGNRERTLARFIPGAPGWVPIGRAANLTANDLLSERRLLPYYSPSTRFV
jgi:hypothetical protein